jgi:Flp pilus assembly protein TadG
VRRAERGSAVVGFALVVLPLVVLLLATVQAVAYLRLRDLVAAAAEQGARRAAAVGASTRDGGAFADDVLERALPRGAAGRMRCTGGQEGGAGGSTLVVVRCRGAVPAVLPLPHPLLPVRVSARAVREGR